MSVETHEAHGASVVKYILGFILSVILTLLAFGAVMMHWMDDWSISGKVVFLLGLAVIQMIVQIGFFLHLNEGPDAKWNIITMWVAIVCVLIIIAGTWLTMQHLNYNMIGGSGRVIRSDVIYYQTEPQSPAPAEPEAKPAAAVPAEVIIERSSETVEMTAPQADDARGGAVTETEDVITEKVVSPAETVTRPENAVTSEQSSSSSMGIDTQLSAPAAGDE